MKRESPLKFLGKAGVAKHVIEFIPDHVDRVVSPFLGGGIIEMILADRGVEVMGYDGDDRLANWWQQWMLHADKIVEDVKKHMLWDTDPAGREGLYVPANYFYDNKGKTLKNFDSDYEAAIQFWLHNRATKTGNDHQTAPYQQCYKLDGPRNIFDKVRVGCPEKLSVIHQDWETTLRSHTDDFLFLDPPYSGWQDEYAPDVEWEGHKGYALPIDGVWKGHNANYGPCGALTKDFEHFHCDLRDHLYHRANWLMCNYDHPQTHRIYKDFPRKILPEGKNKIGTHRSHELLIFPIGTKL